MTKTGFIAVLWKWQVLSHNMCNSHEFSWAKLSSLIRTCLILRWRLFQGKVDILHRIPIGWAKIFLNKSFWLFGEKITCLTHLGWFLGLSIFTKASQVVLKHRPS